MNALNNGSHTDHPETNALDISSIPPIQRNPFMFVLQGTAGAAFAGAIGGMASGYIRANNLAASAFGMGSNWLIISAPFLTLREGVLQFRYWQNERNGVHSLLRKDADDKIASTTAGMITGAGLGWMWRGSAAAPTGAIMYGLIAYTIQSGLSMARNYRLDKAAELYQKRHQLNLKAGYTGSDLTALHTEEIGRPIWWKVLWRNKNDDMSMQARPDPNWDPLGSAAQWIFTQIRTRIDFGPESSPFLNAFDLRYRKVLNAKLDILQAQISLLKTEIYNLEQVTGCSVAPTVSNSNKTENA
ncbi:hypothetical protein QVD99_000895 [Batrachochytrium dendrobatidis]|nr:hypothetical protein O5D80_003746 [Batrachochytrium dendrobatidis]KAK5673448.1 hypothetical protein QVD99_000895 [Batrachochytrium dendrobatidis]